MKKMARKFTATALALVLLLGALSVGFAVSAAVTSGQCGGDAYWTLDDTTGLLTITGTGEFTFPYDYDFTRKIKTVNISQGITGIGEEAFINSGLTSITIPASVTSIGAGAFSFCNNLTGISLPANLEFIGDRAFYYCSKLTGIVIPNGVKSIGDNVFDSCSVLANISIPDSVTSIGVLAFRWCYKLTSITLPSNLDSIGGYAFSGCSSLSSVFFPDSVTNIGDNAFSGCAANLTIKCYESAWCARQFARDHGIKCVLLHEHPEILTEDIPATCGTNGRKVYNCTVCDAVRTEILPATQAHVFQQNPTTTLTCTLDGYGYEICTICNLNTGYKTIPPTGHTSQHINAPATCTATGVDYDKCNVCGIDLCTRTTLPATGHTPGTWETVKQPTSLSPGERVRKCIVCQEVAISEPIPPTGNFPGYPSTTPRGDDGTTNWDFIVPVTHQKTVPAGYLGVYNAQQLNAIRNSLSGNYILMNNIDLSSFGEWTPIPSYFSGVLDGNGYTISNLKITKDYTETAEFTNAGLFRYVTGAVKNLGIASANINVNSSVISVFINNGIIASRSSGVIDNCFNKGAITFNSSAAINCYAGGIVGQGTQISNCYNTGAVNVSNAISCHAGGIAGSATAIESCYNIGNVIVTTQINYNYSLFAYCDVFAGGISGYAETVVNSHNIGTVQAKAGNYALAGGIAGNAGNISYSYNAGPISANGAEGAYVGGIAGHIEAYGGSSIGSSYNAGDLSASTPKNAYVGGIAGLAGIIDSGLSNNISITDCFSTGNISAAGSFARIGGIVGAADKSAYISIAKAYNTGALSATAQTTYSYIGGILGYRESGSSLANCYFLNTTGSAVGSGAVAGDNTQAVSATQMQNASNFKGFDFTGIWGIESGKNQGYPFLKSLPLVGKTGGNSPGVDNPGGDNPSGNNPSDNGKQYITLWGKVTKWEKNFLNYILLILCFGWIWMAF